MTSQPAFGPGGLDRRRAERVPMPPAGGVVSVVGGRMVNVGPYGMMIESPVPMERDAVLQLRLVVAGEKVDGETRVAACTLVSSGKRRVFGIGLEFTKIRSEIQDRLRRLPASSSIPARRAPLPRSSARLAEEWTAQGRRRANITVTVMITDTGTPFRSVGL